MNRVSEVYRKRYRLFLIIAMLCCVAGIAVMYYFYLEKKIPERIMLIENRSEKLDFDVPVQGDISIDKNEKVVETGGICINDTVLSKDKNIHFDMDKSDSILNQFFETLQSTKLSTVPSVISSQSVPHP